MRSAHALRILLAATVLAACAGSRSAPSGAPDPEGLYRSKCSACHQPYEPSSRTRGQWRDVMGPMASKAHLSPTQDALLRGWLETRAADAAAGGGSR